MIRTCATALERRVSAPYYGRMHICRWVVAGLVLAGCISRVDDVDDVDDGESMSTCQTAPATTLEREETVLRLVNEIRRMGASCGGESHGSTHALEMNPVLQCTARAHAEDMRDREFFAHENPDNESAAERVTAAGYRWRTVGENIAAGYPTADDVMTSWLDSPGHCRNVMSPNFFEIGIGYAASTDAYGHYWVQNFGTQ